VRYRPGDFPPGEGVIPAGYGPLPPEVADQEPLLAPWDPAVRPPGRRRGLAGLLGAYGWRMIALPLLIVLTAVVAVEAVRAGGATDPGPGQAGAAAGAGQAGPPAPVVTAGAPGSGFDPRIPSAELPLGGPFPLTGAGVWHVVAGTAPPVGTGRHDNFTVEVENGITAPDGDDAFATLVTDTLANPKSWIGSGQLQLQRVDTGKPDFRVSLTSQATARTLCGFQIAYDTSCYLTGGRVVLNVARWERGAISFGGDLGSYRRYAINHEVGHFFGNGHEPCPADGGLAPVMMQQTLSVSDDQLAALTDRTMQGARIPADHKTCRANAWPFPQASQAAN
jgi:hypothetical protein